MNVKVFTPKILKSGSGLSNLRQFLMSIVATSISIILTFGTAHILEEHKKDNEKRKMAMMIMYDMQQTLDQIATNDSKLVHLFELQMKILANPETFDENQIGLLINIPAFDYSTTIENIFRSNIETINTIGNIAFVDNVSSFYDGRKNYKEVLIDPLLKDAQNIKCYDSLAVLNISDYIYYIRMSYNSLLDKFEVCKLQTGITDEELKATSDELAQLYQAAQKTTPEEKWNKHGQELNERRKRFNQAVAEGKEKLKK